MSRESPRKSGGLPDEHGKVRKDFPNGCKQLPDECGKVPEELPEITMRFHPEERLQGQSLKQNWSGGTSGNSEEWGNGWAEEWRSGGAEEQRFGGAEERSSGLGNSSLGLR
ncbi:hypothetical protein C8R48DRAFT_672209 [Suillus tomentosus]|nr:hypothetical protein C8R48DRAFT_672209 [Suillus tomentosus]